MKSDLDLVITALEAEKKSLQKMIKQSALEYDHLIVYHYSEALLRLDRQLETLYSFRDPLHRQRDELERYEKFLQVKPKKKMKAALWKFWLERRLKDLDERKLDLEAKSKKQYIFNDSQEIDDLLFAINDQKINEFKITLSLYDYGELLFKREDIFLSIKIKLSEKYESSEEPYVDKADITLDDRLPNPLNALGFVYNADTRSYIYKYDLTNFKDAGDIKILLSRLFFDVFNIHDVRQAISISF